MSLITATDLLAAPAGTGELEPRWFDWLPLPGSGQTQLEAVTEKLTGYIATADAKLAAAGVTPTAEAETAGAYVEAYNTLAIEYGRRVGSTTINNEVTQATGSASVKPFIDAMQRWTLIWTTFVPQPAGMGGGMGVSASVPVSFRF